MRFFFWPLSVQSGWVWSAQTEKLYIQHWLVAPVVQQAPLSLFRNCSSTKSSGAAFNCARKRANTTYTSI
jgi:hypothetical protein